MAMTKGSAAASSPFSEGYFQEREGFVMSFTQTDLSTKDHVYEQYRMLQR